MKIAMTGSSGFIGNALKARLIQDGHTVIRLIRPESVKKGSETGTVAWETGNPGALGGKLEGCDAVIHLAGAGISDHRWTKAYKQQILNSRVEGTRSLAEALAGMARKPKIFISASAIGIYGPRGAEQIDEQAGPGGDFLAKVCLNWEKAADPARKAGIRVVHPRFGLVLGKSGGALKKMLLPFQLGLGGVMGNGSQIYSWITLDDLTRALLFLLGSPDAEGSYNFTAPGACSNRDYTKALGSALKRPTIFPMPAFMARLAFGEMADALLNSGQNVHPSCLLKAKFEFKATAIEQAFQQVLN
jgi:uncharacterized protein (TIGR01777 family)